MRARAGPRGIVARALWALAAIAAAGPASASCCVFEDPLLGVNEAAARGRSLRLVLDAELVSSRAAMDGMGGLEEISQRTVRATAIYSPFERVNAVVSVPFGWREWSGGGEVSHATGLGDVDAGVRIAAWRDVSFVPDPTRWAVVRAQALAISLGSSIPTGDDGVAMGGVRADEHAQLGTGAWGPYAGLLYRFQQDPWELVASVAGRVRTTNAYGYRYARGLLAAAELQRRMFGWLSIGGGLDTRWASADLRGGAPVANTGGVLISALASAAVDLGEGVALRARVQVPALKDLAGDQRPGITAITGIQLDVH